MHKILFLLCLLALTLTAKERVEIFASQTQSEGEWVYATGGVVVSYKEYLLSADEARYNKTTSELELFKNIRSSHLGVYKLLGSYAKLNLKDKERTFRPFFMLEKESRVWLCGDEGHAKEEDIDVTSGIMSGCNPNDPLWKIEFTSSDYNTDSKWLNLYNARIYIYDILVFYTPYFGYSLDTTRRTGLLTPSLGISDQEGFYYEQPIYIAEQNWWDLELKPQIRSSRGEGGYSTFRFVDSAHSKGSITAGYFKERQKYVDEYALTNDTHYGYSLSYLNKALFSSLFQDDFQGQSELYIDFNNLNDVDYINLSTNDTTQNATSQQIYSVVNGFYNSERNYLGLYFKYYKDLTVDSNEKTLQQLPTLHYHNYLSTLLEDSLLYNIDVKSTNIHRDLGVSAVQTDMNIPITLRTNLFDEYLNLSYRLELYGQHTSFRGETNILGREYDNGYFARSYNVFGANTQLMRGYENFSHSIELGARYSMGASEAKSGYYDDIGSICTATPTDPRCDFHNIKNLDESFHVDFLQYFHDVQGDEILYHRLSQSIVYNDYESQVGELENELEYAITKGLRYYSSLFYNYDEQSFSKLFNEISFRQGGWNLSLSHLYSDTFLSGASNYTPYTSYFTSSARYTYNDHYSYHAKFNYDMENGIKKGAEVGFLYKKRCWDFGLRLVENNRPILRNGVSDAVFDRYLYFTIVLKPLMRSNSGSSDFGVRMPDILKGS
ncbi:MAG: LPS-assembly protein LptD [Epsilonproteobacteria bacterium]|nr:LPS-assembly protein LptD [Campylobacterota bacterium]